MDFAQTTIAGNLTRDPELRFTANGRAVTNLGVAVNSRHFDKAAGEYRDGKTTFVDVTVWGDTAENIAASMRRGERVIAIGRLDLDTWEGRDGESRSRLIMQADEVGPSLRFVTTASTKAQRGGRGYQSAPGSQQAGGGSWADQYAAGNVQQSPEEMRRNWAAQQPQHAQPAQQAPVREQWGHNPAAGQQAAEQGALGAWGQQGNDDEPPF